MLDSGALFSLGSGGLVAAIGVLGSLLVRRSREGTSMRDAWDRIDSLSEQVDAGRRAARLTEDGLDALWRWSQRAVAEWGQATHPPEFTKSERDAIGRARKAVELSTGPIPKQQEVASG